MDETGMEEESQIHAVPLVGLVVSSAGSRHRVRLAEGDEAARAFEAVDLRAQRVALVVLALVRRARVLPSATFDRGFKTRLGRHKHHHCTWVSISQPPTSPRQQGRAVMLHLHVLRYVELLNELSPVAVQPAVSGGSNVALGQVALVIVDSAKSWQHCGPPQGRPATKMLGADVRGVEKTHRSTFPERC